MTNEIITGIETPMEAKDFAALGEGMVYLRPMSADDLMAEMPESRSEIDVSKIYYALHGPDGSRLAVAENRESALALAKANDVELVSIH